MNGWTLQASCGPARTAPGLPDRRQGGSLQHLRLPHAPGPLQQRLLKGARLPSPEDEAFVASKTGRCPSKRRSCSSHRERPAGAHGHRAADGRRTRGASFPDCVSCLDNSDANRRTCMMSLPCREVTFVFSCSFYISRKGAVGWGSASSPRGLSTRWSRAPQASSERMGSTLMSPLLLAPHSTGCCSTPQRHVAAKP